MKTFISLIIAFAPFFSLSLKFDTQQVGYNLNENTTAVNPLDYWGEWPNHKYHASPANWRFPFYTLFLDRFVNGDPSNDDANATAFEHDSLSNQFRHGGDIAGLIDTLDYIQGMGIKVSWNGKWAPYFNADKLRVFTLLDLLLSTFLGRQMAIRYAQLYLC